MRAREGSSTFRPREGYPIFRAREGYPTFKAMEVSPSGREKSIPLSRRWKSHFQVERRVSHFQRERKMSHFQDERRVSHFRGDGSLTFRVREVRFSEIFVFCFSCLLWRWRPTFLVTPFLANPRQLLPNLEYLRHRNTALGISPRPDPISPRSGPTCTDLWITPR